jgi:uncharacterized protein (DUF1015 family)
MSIIKPFRAYRPKPEMASKVATRSVERYSKEEIKQILAENPFSFLQVINPISSHPLQSVSHQSSNDELLAIKRRFKEFVAAGTFIQDASPCFYLYRQIKAGRHHTGIIGLASVDDYNNDIIKIHEQTLAKREEKLKEYLDVCEINAEPVCLTYPHNESLNNMMQAKMAEKPEYDYSDAGVRHTLWVINGPAETEQIAAIFGKIPAVYIADGHHRAASSARLAETRKESNPEHNGTEPYNFFTAALFADDELSIFSYNRLVKDLQKHTSDSLLNELRNRFEVSPKPENYTGEVQRNIIAMYTQKHWYEIDTGNLNLNSADSVSRLDVSVLSDYILSPIMGIDDLRHDKRVSFMPGIKTKKEIEKQIDSGKAAAAFLLHPVSFEELIDVADSGKEMPPKSTWIEPKLESGLLIYSLEK